MRQNLWRNCEMRWGDVAIRKRPNITQLKYERIRYDDFFQWRFIEVV